MTATQRMMGLIGLSVVGLWLVAYLSIRANYIGGLQTPANGKPYAFVVLPSARIYSICRYIFYPMQVIDSHLNNVRWGYERL